MKIHDLRKIWQKRSVRLTLKVLLGCLAAFIVLAPLLVPPALRWAIETQGSKALGRRVTVEGASFNPFTLAATVHGLQIGEADDKQVFVKLDLVRANLSLASVWYRGLVMDALRVEHPYVHVQRLAENQFNFSDIVQKLASGPKSAETEASSPLRISLNNIELSEGQIVFDDKPVQRVHQITHLNIGVPFISNLPARVDSYVQPRVEATVNGADFRLTGEVKPFSDHHEASLELVFDPTDITQYLVYVPTKLPVKIERAKFSSDVHVVWASGSPAQGPTLALSGKLGLQDVSVRDTGGEPLLALDSLAIDIGRMEPLATPMLAQINAINLDAPRLNVTRDEQGQINFAGLMGGQPANSQAKPAVSPQQGSGQAQTPKVSLTRLSVHKGEVRWHDRSVADRLDTVLGKLEIQLDQFDLLADKPASLKVQGQGGHGEVLALDARLAVKPGKYDGSLSLANLGLENFRPYYAQFVGDAQLKGNASLAGHFAVVSEKEGPAIGLDEVVVSFKDLSLGGARDKQAQVSLPDTQAQGISVDVPKHAIKLGKITSNDARLRLERDKNGQLTLLSLLQGKSPKTGKSGPASSGEAATTEPQAWQLSLGDLALKGWGLHFDDNSGSSPVSLDVADFGLHVSDWANAAHNQAKAELTARVNKAGRLALDGRFGTQPVQGSVHADIRDVDFLAVQPYVDDLYRILVTRGKVSARGDLNFDLSDSSRPDIRYRGNFSVADFNSLDRLNNSDFMRWKLFAFNNVSLQTQPLALTTQEVRLEDFYSRVILDEKGRLNVRELASADEEEALPPVKPQTKTATQVSPAAVSAPVSGGQSMPQVRIGKIVLADGHINYNDRFVKPNYEANLLAVNGGLTGLSSDQTSVAALNLKARMDGAAPVTVTGELNPFRQDSFLDIKADVRDVDLVGVSTYSAKYVGYGIEKGKLSMAVQYQVRDRKLTAENHVTLDQLTFGKKVESPDATKLPVLFAVSLLKDRHGVIDVNMPISGSLDDPQFSVGGVIVKVIVNLLGKAVTAPFALIGSVFGGGGEELSYLDFAPGSAGIAPAGEEKLRTLAKALADRPAIKLEIAGRADPAADVTGLKRARLDGRLRALKAETLVKGGESVGEVDQLQIDAAEYPALLRKVYESAKIDARPRNALGLLKTLSVEEMERIILASYVISEADLENLADQRAQAVRTKLLDQDGISSDRIFLLSSSGAAEPSDGKQAQARAEFLLK